MKSFSLFILVGIIVMGCSNNKPVTVAIQPFDNFDPATTDSIAATIKKAYGYNTVVLSSITMPSEAFVNTKTPRYRADFLIKFLRDQKADSIDYIIGVTAHDISFTKRDKNGDIKSPESKYKDWGILGLGYRPGSSCILSTYRLHHKSKTIHMNRIKKISIHELGHNLGLKHCLTDYCVMQDAAETIKTIDKVNLQLCSNCQKMMI